MQETRRLRRLRAIHIGCALLLVMVVGTLYGPARLLWRIATFDQVQEPWRECTVPLPGDFGQLIYRHRPSHPCFAEYTCQLTVKAKGKDTVTYWLPPLNGWSESRVYWYPAEDGVGPYTRMEDGGREHLVDFQMQVVRGIGQYDSKIVFSRVTPTDGSATDAVNAFSRDDSGKKELPIPKIVRDGRGILLGKISYHHGDELAFTPVR